jgi:trimeric autotransporter adhesin
LVLATLTPNSTSWTKEYIDQPASGSAYVSLAGQYGALLLNANERPLIFYRSHENWLKYFSRESL